MFDPVVLPLLVIVALVVIIGGGILAAHAYLDRAEDWNPWAETVTPGSHRLGAVSEPYRLPDWTPRRRLPELRLPTLPRFLPARPPAPVEGNITEGREEGEIRELSTID